MRLPCPRGPFFLFEPIPDRMISLPLDCTALDAAMYEAKHHGRGQFRLCGPDGTHTLVV